MTAGRGLALILYGGAYEKIHYAFVMAGAAAATGRNVTLFFTMGAIAALKQASGEGPGWADLPTESGDRSATEIDSAYGTDGLATLEELISACAEIGVDCRVCEMGLKAMGLEIGDLRTDLGPEISGMVGFLAAADHDDAHIVFI